MPRKSSSVAAGYAKSSKRKKAKKRSSTRAPSQTPVASASNSSPRPAISPAFKSAPPATAAVKTGIPMRETTSEYSYVVQELQKIGIVAGLMFAIIIVLAFLLR